MPFLPTPGMLICKCVCGGGGGGMGGGVTDFFPWKILEVQDLLWHMVLDVLVSPLKNPRVVCESGPLPFVCWDIIIV